MGNLGELRELGEQLEALLQAPEPEVTQGPPHTPARPDRPLCPIFRQAYRGSSTSLAVLQRIIRTRFLRNVRDKARTDTYEFLLRRPLPPGAIARPRRAAVRAATRTRAGRARRSVQSL